MKKCKLHVLESALEDYKATYPWSQFYSIDSDFTTLGVEDITIRKKNQQHRHLRPWRAQTRIPATRREHRWRAKGNSKITQFIL